MNGTAWTPAEDTLLRKYAGEKTAEEIGTILNRPKHGVHHRIKKLGLCGKLRGENHHFAKHTNTQASIAQMLYDSGFTANEIQDFANCGMSLQTVCDIAAARTRRA